jgi:hypothetical protein
MHEDIKTSYSKFLLGIRLSDEQIDFFNKNGFLHFQNVLSKEEAGISFLYEMMNQFLQPIN